MIQLIMSDMDGTLLDEKGNLPEGFDAVAARLKEKNILFAPASGRQYYALLRQFEAYRDDFLFVAENGTYVVHRGKELFSIPLGSDAVGEIVEVGAGIDGAFVVLCGKKSAYVVSEDAAFLTEAKKYYARLQTARSFKDVEDEILKVAICDMSAGGAEFNSYPRFARYAEQLKIAVSSSVWLDLMHKDANKGAAARRIQEIMGIAPEACMAFGDYLNDVEMLQAVDHSYAMENAHPDLKRAARFSAGSNRERGVIRAIMERVLQAPD